MPGIIGIYPFGLGRENWRTARFVYYGLLALQNRGQETAEIITFDGEFHSITGEGLVEDVFNGGKISSTPGFIGLGIVSPLKNDWCVEVFSPHGLVVIGDGLPFLDECSNPKEAWRGFAELLSDEISRVGDSLKAAVRLVEEIEGGYAFIALTEKGEMIAGRDKRGVKPLEIGSLGFDLGVVASETSALDVLGVEHVSSLGRGEVVRFDPYSVERAQCANPSPPAYCSFEYVYLARPDSVVNGISVYSVRVKIGEYLARETPAKADAVIGIPETAIPFAIGYARTAGLNLDIGFVSTGRRVRTAIKPSVFERLVGVQLKLNPVRSAVQGKDLVLIDDSVVRGTTLRNTVWNLKRRGARRIHVRIGSPPLGSRCPFGVEVPPPDELIARSLSEEEIAAVVGADSFCFLSVDGLARSIGLSSCSLCLRCWTGGVRA